MAAPITINQTLHGYQEGHRLLASSQRLSTRTERLLLEMSDLSGDGIVSGFEEYFTGYPVADEGRRFFALAKTWYANEMERPGCVWTQTLLIDTDELGELENPNQLMSLFIRPNRRESVLPYQQKLTLGGAKDHRSIANEDDFTALSVYELAADLFYSIYQHKRSAVILATSEDSFRRLVFQFWWQQWPALRATFSFCTGALAPRVLPEDKLFALQVAPEKNYYLFAKYDSRNTNIKNAVDLIDASNPRQNRTKPWYEIAISELQGHRHKGYSEFLREFGPTLSPTRTSFSRLTQLFWLMEKSCFQPRSLHELTSLLKRRFPKPTDAGELKAAIYGNKRAWPFLSDGVGGDLESVILNELIETESAEIFDVSDLRLPRRICDLWVHGSEIAFNMTRKCLDQVGPNLNPIRQEFLSAAAKCASAEDIIALTQTNTNLLETALSLNPTIAESAVLWRLDDNRQRYLFARLRSTGIPQTEPILQPVAWDRVAVAMLEGGSDLFAAELDRLLGVDLPRIVLAWHQKTADREPISLGPRWIEVLERYPGQLMTWLRDHGTEHEGVPATHALIAQVLNPHSPEVESASTSLWLDLVRSFHGIGNSGKQIPVLSFLLAVGLTHDDKSASELVVCSFHCVYEAASLDALPWRSWSQLERAAPSYGLIWSWDKCHRLEEALITKVARCNWPADILLRAANSPNIIRQIIKRANDSSTGRKVLAKLRESIRQNAIQVDPATERLLGKR